jgi:hypothetical protein
MFRRLEADYFFPYLCPAKKTGMILKKILPLILFAFIIYSCGKHATATAPSSPEESLFRTTCSKCHGLGKADPAKHTQTEWVKIVEKMQHIKGKMQFTDDQKAQILVYINARAKKE